MDLYGAGGYFRFTLCSWGAVIDLALEFSWIPTGTQPSRNDIRQYRRELQRKHKSPVQVNRAVSKYRKEYESSYYGNDGQAVTARDAKNLAYVLSTALSAISDLFTRAGKRTRMRADFSATLLKQLRALSNTASREMLQEFIDFCNAGRFEIH